MIKISSKILLLILSISLLGGAAVFWATSQGIGVTWDGVSYIQGAREIIRQHSYTSTHFPPLTSLVLVLGSLFDPRLLFGANLPGERWLYIFLFCASIFCFGFIMHQSSYSLRVVFAGMFIFITSLRIFPLFIEVSSEAVFFGSWLLSFLFFLIYDNKKNLIWLAGSALFAGLSMLARYSGIVVIVTVGLIILIRKIPFRVRLKEVILYFCISVFLPSIYILTNIIQTGTLTSRTFAIHPPHLYEMDSMMSVILGYLIPVRINLFLPNIIRWASVSILALAMSFTLFYIFKRKWGGLLVRNLILMCSVFIILYLPFLLFSKTFFDENIDLDTRQLSPVFIALLLIVCGISQIVFERFLDRKYRLLLMVVFIYFAALNLYPFIITIQNSHSQGIGYTNVYWQHSETLKYVDEHLSAYNVITNQPLIISLYSDTTVFSLPNQLTNINKEKYSNPALLDEIQKSQDLLRKQDVFIVYFNTGNLEGYLTPEQVSRDIVPVVELYDGIIYKRK